MIVPASSWPVPTPEGWLTAERLVELAGLFRQARTAAYRNDFADDWTPRLEGDCQGKTAWLMEALGARGWPAGSLRGLICGYRPWAARNLLPAWLRGTVRHHALLVVRVTWNGKRHDLVADIRRRALVYGVPAEYVEVRPAVAWRAGGA